VRLTHHAGLLQVWKTVKTGKNRQEVKIDQGNTKKDRETGKHLFFGIPFRDK